jgi:hypothetical protein
LLGGGPPSLGFASLRGGFAALLGGGPPSLGFASLRGGFAALLGGQAGFARRSPTSLDAWAVVLHPGSNS